MIRNKKILTILIILLLLCVLGYAGYTARNLITGPRIFIAAPAEGLTVTAQVIELSGSAPNTTILLLNNRNVTMNATGDFTERMLLTPGANTFIFDATDRFGNTAQETLQIMYTPQTERVLQLRADDSLTQ